MPDDPVLPGASSAGLDPMLILAALAVAALVAAAVFLLCSWPGRTIRTARTSAGGVLGVALGFYAGCWWLGLRPHWPPREDQDRFLFLLLPAVVGVELLVAFAGRLPRLVWLLRLLVAAVAARILLHDTNYLTDLAGPGTREWTTTQAWLVLGGLAAVLAGVWLALVWLARRRPGRSIPLAVALTCGGAAVIVMLSGYATGGQMGLPLAAALVGVLAASLMMRQPHLGDGVLGLGVVGLFALLVVGRFFGQLATGYAALVFFGLSLAWLPELPFLRRVGPRLRGVARVVLVAIPVVVALTLAQQKFARDSARTSPGSKDPSIQDYLDFGK
jgi:hypothetical protein